MIILGVLLLIVGVFLFRPLAYVGVVLIALGVLFYLLSVPGPLAGHYY